MHSCNICSCVTEKICEPIRLAGTWKIYSNSAMDQLITITNSRGLCLYLRWPYHAKVMNTFEMTSRMTVFTPNPSLTCLTSSRVVLLQTTFRGLHYSQS